MEKWINNEKICSGWNKYSFLRLSHCKARLSLKTTSGGLRITSSRFLLELVEANGYFTLHEVNI
jgi:hypothetical protein